MRMRLLPYIKSNCFLKFEKKISANLARDNLSPEPRQAVLDNRLALVRMENRLVAVANHVEPAHLKFFFCNISDRDVDVIWIDKPMNISTRYAQLRRGGGRVRIGTYENHRWIFRDSQDGTLCFSFLKNNKDGKLTANGPAFVARAPEQDLGSLINTRTVYISARTTDPPQVRSLKDACVRTVCALINLSLIESIGHFGLPAFIEVELAEYLIRCVHYKSKYDEQSFSQRDKICDRLKEFVLQRHTVSNT